MNWEAVSNYLERQSRFCKERAWTERESIEITRNMVLLADIYAVLSHAILEGLGQAPQWPPDEHDEQSLDEQSSKGSKLLLQENDDEIPF
jgi:hypothetical protein